MSIDEWLAAHKFTASQFADMLGCSPSMVSVWRSGKTIPRARYMARIEKFTRGEIGPADFFPRRASRKRNAAGDVLERG